MTPLGKSIVFYLKYRTEMQRLNEGESGDLEGLSEPEKTREMAQAVGEKANRQAADLLEACAVELQQHFSSIGKCLSITSRKMIERKWSLTYSVWPKGRMKPVKPKLAAGIDILRLDKPEIIPWLWCTGGDKAEQHVEYILKERAKVRSKELSGRIGWAGLGRIQIFPSELVGFEVDREPIVEQVRQAFLSITPADLDALWPK
jgi:hypothetical protein